MKISVVLRVVSEGHLRVGVGLEVGRRQVGQLFEADEVAGRPFWFGDRVAALEPEPIVFGGGGGGRRQRLGRLGLARQVGCSPSFRHGTGLLSWSGGGDRSDRRLLLLVLRNVQRELLLLLLLLLLSSSSGPPGRDPAVHRKPDVDQHGHGQGKSEEAVSQRG